MSFLNKTYTYIPDITESDRITKKDKKMSDEEFDLICQIIKTFESDYEYTFIEKEKDFFEGISQRYLTRIQQNKLMDLVFESNSLYLHAMYIYFVDRCIWNIGYSKTDFGIPQLNRFYKHLLNCINLNDLLNPVPGTTKFSIPSITEIFPFESVYVKNEDIGKIILEWLQKFELSKDNVEYLARNINNTYFYYRDYNNSDKVNSAINAYFGDIRGLINVTDDFYLEDSRQW